jgi:hypothetical protein
LEVSFGIPDLGVLGLLAELELGEPVCACMVAFVHRFSKRSQDRDPNREDDQEEQEQETGVQDAPGQARDSSRPRRAAYRLVIRLRRARAEGQSATSAPPSEIRPPSQIQVTIGLTIIRKVAGGAFRT